MELQYISGCLYGMALGDALGAETEFLDIGGILARFPPSGPQEPPGNPARVTDDTQMALAVGDALLAAPRPYEPDSFGEHLRRTFVDWYNSPDNDRAPGSTCLTGCENLMAGMAWHEACDMNSKGCGANMRVMPVGLLHVAEATRAKIAQFQAAFTHGHPTGLAAADLTAFVIADLAHGGTATGLIERVRFYAQTQREIYHDDWLGRLWMRAHTMPTALQFISRGWDECLENIIRVHHALGHIDYQADPCQATGAGWVAEEAFATALLCFLMYPDDPVAVIRRAAVTSGDSDSIACIAGAFAGARHGVQAWPTAWVEHIEYRDHIQAMSVALAEQHLPESAASTNDHPV